MSPISALKILLLVNSFMQISVDIYKEPFTIKCCAMYDPTKAVLYIYWLLMINTLFVEWISRQNQLLRPKYLVEETFNHLPGNKKDQLSAICSCGTWRLEALPYSDTQSLSIINGHESGGKPRKETQQLLNEFHQLATKNLNVNAVQQSIASVILYSIKGKKIIVFTIWPAKIRDCPAKKLFGRSSWPATYCPLFWALRAQPCYLLDIPPVYMLVIMIQDNFPFLKGPYTPL